MPSSFRTIIITPMLATLLMSGCSDRSAGLNFMSPEQENQQGQQAYAQTKTTEKICTDPTINAFVQKVASRLEAVANPEITGAPFAWEVTVFQSDTVNAWCMPGGKIGVYTGILPFCQNEAGLATVLSHEIGHAVLRHGGQRMTNSTILDATGQTMQAFLQSKGLAPTTSSMAMVAFGAVTQVGAVLPFSRSQETQADDFGLSHMAKAGYDPAQALAFWNRFAAIDHSGSGTAATLQNYLSDHPMTADRIKDLQSRLPAATQQYQTAPQQFGSGDAIPAAVASLPHTPPPATTPAPAPGK